MDSGTDSVTSTPRSTQKAFNVGDDLQGIGNVGGGGRVRFMCSFGGRILPRPHDNQLRYVGGDTRIVAVSRNTTYAALLAKLSKLCPVEDVTVKYQLPNEELDALITVASDEDVENMMEEWERFAHQQQQLLQQQQQNTNNSQNNNNNNNHNPNNNNKPSRLRLFLFANNNYKNGADNTNTNTNAISILGSEDSRGSDLASLLDGSTKRENWFLDALNGGGKAVANSGGLERGRSEASSIAAEVPDCLFGLDNLDDTQIQTTTQTQQQHHQLLPSRLRNARDILSDHIPASDPSSPSPAANSPFGSTSSAPAAACVPSMMPNVKLPPVKTKPDNNNNNNNSMDGSVDLVGEPGSGSSAGFQQQPNSAGYGAGQAVWAQQQQLQQQQQPPPFQPATSHFPGQPALQPMPIYYVAAPPPGAAQVRAMPVPGQYVQPQYHQQIPQQQQGGQVPMGYHQAVAAGPGGQIYRQVAVSAGDPYQEMQARMVAAGGNQQTVYYGVRSGAGPVPAYHPLQGGGEEMVGFANSDPNAGRG